MSNFDYTSVDAQAMPVSPVAAGRFDFAAYEDHAAAAEERFAAFSSRPEGVAVWQRVRVADVFRDGCRDMRASLECQLGGLSKALHYASDAPNYLEPWYGIGVTASAFGGDYDWPEGQAPVVRPLWHDVSRMAAELPLPRESAIMRRVKAMIEYFLEETSGRLPMSWSDLQNPLNAATELIDTSAFFAGFIEAPEAVRAVLSAMTGEVIRFTQEQTALIGDALVRPGHGFASARCGRGIGLSSDNLVMLSPRTYKGFCVPNDAAIGKAFGGVAIHSCGNWARWADAVKSNPELVMVDGAFSPQTDPDYNSGQAFREAFANTGVIVHARIVGAPEEVLTRVKELWGPGMRLVVVTYIQDPAAQRQLYEDIHAVCG